MLRNWQLLAAAVWGALAIATLSREALFDAETLARLPVRNWTVACLIAAFLCLWNLARWYQAKAARAEREARRADPLQPNPAAKPGYEYNPEFDFQKRDENRG